MTDTSTGLEAASFARPPLPVTTSKRAAAAWMLCNPWVSWQGAQAVRRTALTTPTPPTWATDIKGKRVLVVGTGPSLDRVTPEFFAGFDTALYVNFAMSQKREGPQPYFFTGDIGMIRPVLDKIGPGALAALGNGRRVVAPIYLDQWNLLTDQGRDLFTFLSCDRTSWIVRPARIGPVRLPLIVRCAPSETDWTTYTLPEPCPLIPVPTQTSALGAVMFAAVQDAREIGLIGCDFSAGRSQGLAGTQAAAGATTFSGAAEEFKAMAAALQRNGVTAINHSWLV